MAGDRTCIGPHCKEPAARGDLCWGHAKQRSRGQALRAIEKLSPEERVIEAGSAWLEAEDEGEYRTARVRFLRACEQLFLAQGWRVPRPDRSSPAGGESVEQLALAFEARARRRSVKR